MSSKAGKSKPKKISSLPPPTPVTIKQCLTWPEPALAKKSTKNTAGGSAPKLKSNPKQEESLQNGRKPCCQLGGHFELAKENGEVKVENVGTVSEALRGWPHPKEDSPEIDMDAYYAQNNENSDFNVDKEPDLRDISRSKKATFLPLKKEKKPPVAEEGGPSMGDLMAYRYHREYAEKLQLKNEREEKRKAKLTGDDKESREKTKLTNNVKANKAGQLRSISLAEKVDQPAQDLWQMGKFKNVKAKISSKRNGQEEESASADEANYLKCNASHQSGNSNIRGGKGGYEDTYYTDNEYPHGMDILENQASPLAGFYQDGGLDSPLSYHGDFEEY